MVRCSRKPFAKETAAHSLAGLLSNCQPQHQRTGTNKLILLTARHQCVTNTKNVLIFGASGIAQSLLLVQAASAQR